MVLIDLCFMFHDILSLYDQLMIFKIFANIEKIHYSESAHELVQNSSGKVFVLIAT